MNVNKVTKWKLLLILVILSGTRIYGQDEAANPDQVKPAKSNSGSLFGPLPEKNGSGGGIFLLYKLTQFSKPEEGMIAGGRGYSQYGNFLRIGGFAVLTTGLSSPYTQNSLGVYGGPFFQVTLRLDPLILALGANVGLGMDFNRSNQIDYLLYPHLELELRLFENLSVSTGIGFFKNRSSHNWPTSSQYFIMFGLNFTHFSTGKNN